MSPITPTIRERARVTVRRAVDRGEPTTDVYPIAVGMNRLYASADPDKICSYATIKAGDTIFHLGFRR
jgi:hypothetical protein